MAERDLISQLAEVVAAWLEKRPSTAYIAVPGLATAGTALMVPGITLTRWVGAALMAVSVVCGSLITWWGKRTRDAQVELAAAVKVSMQDAVAPLARMVEALCHLQPGRRAAELKAICQRAADAARLVRNDATRTRVVVYQLETGPAPDNSRRERLRPVAHSGRDQVPSTFDSTSPTTARLFATLHRGEPEFVEDTAAEDATRWSGGHPTEYQTFITVPLVCEAEAYGLLCVDAPKVGDLGKNDVPAYQVLAAVLTIAFAITRTTSPATRRNRAARRQTL